MKKSRNTKMCRTPECYNNRNGSRGMCTACYSAAMSLVKKGQTTWETLERCGLSSAPLHFGVPGLARIHLLKALGTRMNAGKENGNATLEGKYDVTIAPRP
jgi:hypothetical protein